MFIEMNEHCNCQERVNQFSRAAGAEIPAVPRAMTRDQVVFLTKMVLSEMQELLDTVTSSSDESLELMKSCIGVDPSKHHEGKITPVEVVAEQSDALVDAWYYMLNMAGKNGHNLSRVFDVVHSANMAKVDPVSGKCLIRESDGKILKPPGWTPPDIVAEIYRQGFPREQKSD